MSSIDNRIVKMQFDNEQFERNVSKSMNTLDKFEEKLQFKKAVNGVKGLQVAFDSITFSKMASSIESIEKRLSGVGVMAATVVSRITNSLIDGAMKIENATIGQIKSGGWNRAMNIENAKFSIQGLKGDWDQLYKAMDYAVTGTAYGIDQAAKAASTLLASQVDYQKVIETNGTTQVTMMHKALRAISGVAAQTNSDFDSISRIFTTIAGQGKVMAEQLNMLASRGMNAAAILGEQLHMTEAEVRGAVSDGLIDFETFAMAMDNAFGEHATDANKTFTGSLSNMKAALSRFGAVFATPVIQKTNKFFIALTDRIKEMKNAISDVTENGEVLEKHLEGHFAEMWEKLIDLADILVHKIDLTWFWKVADAADEATIKITGFIDKLLVFFGKNATGTEKVAKTTYDLTKITQDELDLANKVIQGSYGNGQKRVKALAEAAEKLGLDPVKIQEYVNVVSKYGYSFEKAKIQIVEATDEVEEFDEATSKSSYSLEETLTNLRYAAGIFSLAFDKVKENLSMFVDAVKYGLHNASVPFYAVSESLKKLAVSFNNFSDTMSPTHEELLIFSNFVENVVETVLKFIGAIAEAAGGLMNFGSYLVYDERSTVFDLIDTFSKKIQIISNRIGVAFENIQEAAYILLYAIKDVFDARYLDGKNLVFDIIQRAATRLAEFTQLLIPTEYEAETFGDCLLDIVDIVLDLLVSIQNVKNTILDFVMSLISGAKQSGRFADFLSSITGVLGSLYRIAKSISKLISGIFRAIAIAFFRVFKPADVANYLDIFALGLADLFELLEPSDEFIYALADGLTIVTTVIAAVIDKILELISLVGKFFSKVSGRLKGDTTVEDSFGDMGIFAELAVTAVETLLTTLGKFIDFVGKIPDTLGEFADALNQQEGVIRLKDSIKKLWETMKGSVDTGLKPFKSFLEELSDTTGVAITVDDVAKWFGWLAGKIADLVDKLPTWYDDVVKFFTDVKDDVVKFFEDVDKMVGLSDFADAIGAAFEGDDKTLFEKIKDIVHNVGDWIFKGLESIDWANIGETSITLGVLAMIWEFVRIGEGITNLILSVKTIPDAITKLFKGFNAFISAATTTLANFSRVALIGTIAASIIGIAMSIAILSNIPADRLADTAGVVILIMAILGSIIRGISGIIAIIEHRKEAEAAAQVANVANAVALAKEQVKLTLVNFIGAAVMIIGIAYAVRLIAMTFVDIYEWLHQVEIQGGTIGATLITVLGILGGILVVSGIIFAIMAIIKRRLTNYGNATPGDTRVFDQGIAAWKNAYMLMFAFAAVMMSLAGALYLVSKAVDIIQSTWVGGDVVFALLGVTAVIVAFGGISAFIASHLGGLRWQNVLAFSGLILSFSFALSIIIAEIAGVAIMLKLANLGGLSEELILAFGLVAALIAVLGTSMAAMGSAFRLGRSSTQKFGMLALILAEFAGVIYVCALAINVIADSIRTEKGFDIALLGVFIGIIAALALAAVAVAWAADAFTFTPKEILTLSVVILALAASVSMIALSIAVIAMAVQGLTEETMQKTCWILAAAFVTFGVLLAGAGIFVAKASSFDFDKFLKLAASIALLSAGILLFSVGMYALMTFAKDMPIDAKVITTMVVSLLLLVGIIAALAAISKAMSSGSLGGADELVKLGLATIEFSVALIVLAAALYIIQGVDYSKILSFAVAIGILLGVVAAILWITKGSTQSLSFLQGLALVILSAGGSVLVMALGVSILTAALGVLSPLMHPLALGLNAIFTVLEDHKALTIVFLVLFGAIVAVIIYLAVHVAPALTAAIEAICNIIKAAGDVIIGVINAITGHTRNTMNRARTVMPAQAKMLIAGVLVSVASAITESGPEILQKIGGVIFNVIDWLISIAGPLAGKLLDWIVEIIDALSVQIDTHSNRIAASIANVIGSLVDIIYRLIANGLGGIFTWIGDFFGWEGLSDYGKDINDSASELVRSNAEQRRKNMEQAIKEDEKIKDMVDEYKKIEEEMKASGSIVKASDNDSKGSLDIMKSIGSTMGKSGSMFNLGGATTMGGNAMGHSFMDMMGGMTKSVNGFGGAMDAASISAENLGVNITGMPSAQQDALISSGKAFRTEAGEVFTLKGIDNGTDSFITQLQGDATDIFKENPALDNTFGMGGYGFGETMVDGETLAIENGWGDVYSAADENAMAVGDAATDNIDYVKEKNSELAEVGANAIIDKKGLYGYNQTMNLNGVITAIRRYAAEGGPVDQATEYFCSQMHHYFEQYNQIASPSKLYYKTTGFIGQAIVNSINDSSSAAGLAMEDLSNAMIVSFGNPLDYVSQIASGDIQYDPSIRPVLDTSSIARGAYGINTMFDNQNVALSGFSGKLAADITGLDTTNNQMVNELRSLRADMNSMTEQITNMQIVMDGGQLVGAIAPTMDNALGSRATMRRRGN